MEYGDLKVLASGTAPTGSVVYTAPAGETAQVSMIWLNNIAEDGEKTIKLSFDLATEVVFFNEALLENESYEISPKVPFILEDGETLIMEADDEDEFDYLVIGRESV